MFDLMHNGKSILRGTYQQCVMRQAEMRKISHTYLNSLAIMPCDIDADGFTGYSL